MDIGLLDIDALRDELMTRGLPIDGSRAVLLRRLRGSIDDQPPSPVREDEEDNGHSPERVPPRGRQQQRNRDQWELELLRRENELLRRERDWAQGNTERHAEEARDEHVQVRRSMCSISEISAMLPSFDPTDRLSLDAEQFVRRVDRLQMVYRWNETLLLFATVTKLKGPAKQWHDSVETDLDTWQKFSIELCAQFPLRTNEADIHRQLAQRKRQPNEELMTYAYEMQAIGRRGRLTEKAIVSYIIEGLADVTLSDTLAVSGIQTVHQLLERIDDLQRYKFSRQREQQRSYNHSAQVSRAEGVSVTKCFNCNERGHISRFCPTKQMPAYAPTTGERVVVLPTMSESAERPPQDRPSVNILRTIPERPKKTATVNGCKMAAMVDTGSDISVMTYSEWRTSMGQIDGSDSIRLYGFGDLQERTMGSLTVIIEIDGVEAEVKMYVVDDCVLPVPLVVGTDFIGQPHVRMVYENNRITIERMLARNTNSTPTMSTASESETHQLQGYYQQYDVQPSMLSNISQETVSFDDDTGDLNSHGDAWTQGENWQSGSHTLVTRAVPIVFRPTDYAQHENRPGRTIRRMAECDESYTQTHTDIRHTNYGHGHTPTYNAQTIDTHRHTPYTTRRDASPQEQHIRQLNTYNKQGLLPIT